MTDQLLRWSESFSTPIQMIEGPRYVKLNVQPTWKAMQQLVLLFMITPL
jgi:hypothetical protein